MENRDRDKMNKNISSTKTPSNIDKNKGDSRVDFGEKIGRSENLNNEPGGRLGSQGSSGMKSSGSSKVSGQKVSGDKH